MSSITVSASQVPDYHGGETTLKMRIYANRSFVAADGTRVIGGSVGTQNFFKELDCTVDVNDVVQVPSFDIQTTEDAAPNDCTYTFALFTNDDEWVATIYDRIRIAGDHADPTTMADIAEYNEAEPACLDTNYYTATQIDAMIANLTSTATKMTEVIYGVGKLSHAASNVAQPIVMGHNDPLMRQMRYSYHLESYGHTVSGLNAAITAIGSQQATLIVTQDVPISSANVTIPNNILVRIEGSGRFTMSGGRTLTIGLLEEPAGRKVFYGVDASNHVILGKGATRFGNLAWYMGISSTDDCSLAIEDLKTSAGLASGFQIFVPSGAWKIHNITAVDHLDVVGPGQGISATTSAVFIPKDGTTSYLWRLTGNFRNIAFHNIVFSASTNASTSPLLITGVSGSTGFGADFRNCTFHRDDQTFNGLPLMNADTDQAYEIMRANFYNCQWLGPDGTKCVYIDSVNTLFKFDSCSFQVGKGDSYGVDAFNAGIEIINCDFRGAANTPFINNVSVLATLTCSITSGTTTLTTSGAFTQAMVGQRVANATAFTGGDVFIKRIISATSAELTAAANATISAQTTTIYKWTTSTLKSGCAIRLGAGALLKANIQGCADEGFNYSLKVIGGSLTGPPIKLTNNLMQGRILLEASCVIYSSGNRYFSCSWGDAIGTGSLIQSNDTVFKGVVENFSIELPTAKLWGPDHLGGGTFTTEFGYRDGLPYSEFGRWVRIKDRSGDDRSRPLLDLCTFYNTVSTAGQTMLRWGIWDAATDTFLNGYHLNRNPDSGWTILHGTDSLPYRGWITNFATGYDADLRVNVTQDTDRSTTVVANGIHGTITSHNASLAAGASVLFELQNSLIQNGHDLEVWVQSGSTHNYTTVQRTRVGGNLAKILVTNNHPSTAETGTLKIGYRVILGGKFDGTTTL